MSRNTSMNGNRICAKNNECREQMGIKLINLIIKNGLARWKEGNAGVE